MSKIYAVRIAPANLQLPEGAVDVSDMRASPLDAVNTQEFELAAPCALEIARYDDPSTQQPAEGDHVRDFQPIGGVRVQPQANH